jgi:hypothetical protein
MAKPRSYPLPAAIDAGKWDISEDIRARVDLNARKMYVPLAMHRQAAAIRAHELAHVSFTPKRISAKKTKGVSELSLQCVEDYRVNTLARRAGVDTFDVGCPQAILDGALANAKLYGRDKAFVALALASFTDSERERCIAEASDPDRAQRVYNEVTRILRSGRLNWTFDATCRGAKALDAAYPDSEGETEKPEKKNGKPEKYGREVFSAKDLDPKWGNMTIEKPYLSAPKRSRAVRVSDSGTVFRAPHRLMTDQRVFRACLRAPMRGTVLIDASGSMHLSADDVARIAKTIPAGTVAAYCGQSDRGILRILAHRGKLCSDAAMDLQLGGNVVDGPALQWLGQQSMPRLWVCDGQVTGKGDDMHPALTTEARALAARYGIKRVGDVRDLTIANFRK